MLYQDRLKKWAVVRMNSGKQPVVLERFRSVADAEGHLKVLKKQMPRESLMVVFDRPPVDDVTSSPSAEVVPTTDETSAS